MTKDQANLQISWITEYYIQLTNAEVDSSLFSEISQPEEELADASSSFCTTCFLSFFSLLESRFFCKHLQLL